MLRRKDIYVLLMLMGVIVVALLFVNAFNIGGSSIYVKDIGLTLAWVFSWILAVTVSARALPNEEKTGTIFALLAKPITRWELILGKWLGSWAVVSGATLCFYALVVGVVHLRGGAFALVPLAQGFLLHSAALAVICALGLALSTRMNYDAAATFCFAATVGALVILPRVPDLLMQIGFEPSEAAVQPGQVGRVMGAGFESLEYYSLIGLYAVLPHFELFDMRQTLVHTADRAGWKAVALILYYGLHMSAVFLLFARLGYERKRFSRGDIR